MNSKLFAVIKREYLQQVRTKAFWIATFLIPSLGLVFIFIQVALSRTLVAKGRIGVVDLTGRLYERNRRRVPRAARGRGRGEEASEKPRTPRLSRRRARRRSRKSRRSSTSSRWTRRPRRSLRSAARAQRRRPEAAHQGVHRPDAADAGDGRSRVARPVRQGRRRHARADRELRLTRGDERAPQGPEASTRRCTTRPASAWTSSRTRRRRSRAARAARTSA